MMLMIQVDGVVIPSQVVGLSGLHLQVKYKKPDGSECTTLIDEWRAVDRNEFWKLWTHMGGKSMRLRWEDGTEFQPGV